MTIMSEQIHSRDEIAAVARRCWETNERCPYPAGTEAHNEWVRVYAGIAADELGRQVRENRAAVRRGEGRL